MTPEAFRLHVLSTLVAARSGGMTYRALENRIMRQLGDAVRTSEQRLYTCDALGELKADGLVGVVGIGQCDAVWIATQEGKRMVRKARKVAREGDVS